jgi:hypothetical protein
LIFYAKFPQATAVVVVAMDRTWATKEERNRLTCNAPNQVEIKWNMTKTIKLTFHTNTPLMNSES